MRLDTIPETLLECIAIMAHDPARPSNLAISHAFVDPMRTAVLRSVRLRGEQVRKLHAFLEAEPDLGRRCRSLEFAFGREEAVDAETMDALVAMTPVVSTFAITGGFEDISAVLAAARARLVGLRNLVIQAYPALPQMNLAPAIAASRSSIMTALHFGSTLRSIVLANILDLEVPIGKAAFPVLVSLSVTNIATRLVAEIANAAPRLTTLDSAIFGTVGLDHLDEKTVERLKTVRLSNSEQRPAELLPSQLSRFRSLVDLTLSAGIGVDRDVLFALPPSIRFLSMAQTHNIKLVVECVRTAEWLPSLGELVCARFAHESASSLTTYDRLLLRIGCESRGIALRIVAAAL